MLDQLPVEIFLEIVSQLTDKRDLKHLCEINSGFYKVIIPLLYQTVTIRSKDERSLGKIKVPKFRKTPSAPRSPLWHTKDMKIESKIHSRTFERCIHDEAGRDWVQRLTDSLVPFLHECQEDGLRSFKWGLGTCIPPQILGPSGWLSRWQKNIDSICLVTDGACSWSTRSKHPISLSAFRNLKTISWSGIRTALEFKALHDSFQQVSTQLTNLEIDLIDVDRVGEPNTLPSNNFAIDVLGLKAGMRRPMFPCLHTLSLGAVGLWLPQEMACAFGFEKLHSLKLLFCPNTVRFLDWGSLLGPPVLKSLHYKADVTYQADESVADFLKTFEGLERLAISLDEPGTLDIWHALSHHKSTLKAYAHHETVLKEDLTGMSRESDGLYFLVAYEEEMVEWVDDPSKNPFKDLRLEFLGVCIEANGNDCEAAYTKHFLSLFIGSNTLRVLHIRQSGKDLEFFENWGLLFRDRGGRVYGGSNRELHFGFDPDQRHTRTLHKRPPLTRTLNDLAQWAFGPDGLPSLEVIAFGDFSYNGRYAWGNVILSRKRGRQCEFHKDSKWPCHCVFEYIEDDDAISWDLLDEYSDMLEACPMEPLFDD